MAAQPPRLSKEQLDAWRAFLRAHSTMLRRIARDLEEAELPPLTWYDVLAALRDSPDGKPLKQVELAERVLLSNSGLSRLVDRIEAKGLVERVRCPGDRRSLNIQLTDAGREMLEQMWPVYARGIAEDFLPALGSNAYEMGQRLEQIGRECQAPPSSASARSAASAACAAW
ncbi:MAG TPA: MarR family transcriptional regulator, partial [Solirubrobacterales bacterium]|nr:MarR family transcriptional regulator [Solirubrobacterales bacterium]